MSPLAGRQRHQRTREPDQNAQFQHRYGQLKQKKIKGVWADQHQEGDDRDEAQRRGCAVERIEPHLARRPLMTPR